MKTKNDYVLSSGNVFEDLEFENPEECLAKAELARQINNLIKQKTLTQKATEKMLDVDKSQTSSLSKGKVSGFSIETLFHFLNVLGQDITIKVTPKKVKTSKAQVKVTLPKLKEKTPQKKPLNSNVARVQARKKK